MREARARTNAVGAPGSAGAGGAGRPCEKCRLEDCPLFHDSPLWASYLRAQTLHQFRARQTVFHEGTPASSVYILCHGDVKMSLADQSGARRIIQVLSSARSPLEVLDTISLGAPLHLMTCETLTTCQVCCINKVELTWLMRQEPDLTNRVLAALSDEATRLFQHLRENLAGQVRERLARVLVRLAERHGVPSPRGVELSLPLQRQEWAELVGTSRETVARLFSALQRDGTLALNGKRVTILQSDRLHRLAQ